ncbi:hypothetical protein KR044_009570, partial [Drosophila immigrans]
IMEDEDDSIYSSPTPVRAHSSSRLRHWQRNDASIDGSKTKCGSPKGTDKDTDEFELHMQMLCEADRLDCQRALEEPQRPRIVPASEKFMSLQWLLESQQLPMEEITTVAETHSTAVDQQEAEGQAPSQVGEHSNIVDQILKDFCSSPSYLDDAQPTYFTHPDFRFYNKQIRTYSRQNRKQLNVILDDDEDERISCSSGLSVQEDFITQMPTTKHCNFDANSSQMICENLLNLSAFFTQNQVKSCSSIDLPPDRVQTEVMAMEEPQDAEDILRDNGYCIGNTEECRLPDDNDAIKAIGK